MKKLNCSFPWISSTDKDLEKCGSKERVQDLVKLVNDANFHDPIMMKELKEFGCTLENCHSTNWVISSWQRAGKQGDSDIYTLNLNFPSSSKVYLKNAYPLCSKNFQNVKLRLDFFEI